MKRIAMFAVAFCLAASAAFAGDGRNWTVQPAASWTVTDNVQVRYFFMENGVQVNGPDVVVNFGTAEQVDTDYLVDGVAFLGSGRTICLNAVAFRGEEPATVVTATESCFRFPFGALEPPTLLSP